MSFFSDFDRLRVLDFFERDLREGDFLERDLLLRDLDLARRVRDDDLALRDLDFERRFLLLEADFLLFDRDLERAFRECDLFLSTGGAECADIADTAVGNESCSPAGGLGGGPFHRGCVVLPTAGACCVTDPAVP